MDVANLSFTNVNKRIRYQFPYTTIFYDRTGDLTDKGAGSWAIPWHPHNYWPGECTDERATIRSLDGIACDPSVQVRRISFHNGVKSLELQGMMMYLF
jgi:hypothetical protein